MNHNPYPKNLAARVIINEQHALNPAQGRILGEHFGTFTLIRVPASGLSRDEQRQWAADLLTSLDPVVFISPVPLLLAIMAGRCGRSLAARNDNSHPSGTPPVFLFHNDSRTKTETRDGRISTVLSPDGWELLLL